MGAEEVLELAEERGFTVLSYTADKSEYCMHRKADLVGMNLYPKENAFKIFYHIDFELAQITTPKCGSFELEERFWRMYNTVEEMAQVIVGNKDWIQAQQNVLR